MLLAELMNKSKKAKPKLTAWIDKYDGKIIEFQVDNLAFYIVFTKENVRFQKGSYPSPDVIMTAKPQILLGLLSGKTRLSSSLIIEGKCKVFGNFHDVIAFTRIITSLEETT
jgi:putative sterol carrier protein